MLNKILNLLGSRRMMIVEGGEDTQLFGGSYDTQPSENNFTVETQPKPQVLPVRLAKLTSAYGTAAFSMPVDAFNSQLG